MARSLHCAGVICFAYLVWSPQASEIELTEILWGEWAVGHNFNTSTSLQGEVWMQFEMVSRGGWAQWAENIPHSEFTHSPWRQSHLNVLSHGAWVWHGRRPFLENEEVGHSVIAGSCPVYFEIIKEPLLLKHWPASALHAGKERTCASARVIDGRACEGSLEDDHADTVTGHPGKWAEEPAGKTDPGFLKENVARES